MGKKIQPLTILQVSEELKIPKPTPRFWEKEFNGVVVPPRTHGGQRRYTAQNLLVLEEIKKCLENGLNLPEIGERIHRGCEKEEFPSSKPNPPAKMATEMLERFFMDHTFFQGLRPSIRNPLGNSKIPGTNCTGGALRLALPIFL